MGLTRVFIVGLSKVTRAEIKILLLRSIDVRMILVNFIIPRDKEISNQ